jgi:glycine/D-amino acid oxidase-like deaminating enzyme
MNKHQPHIVVIGAGIIGASIAYHLARDGARVTVVEGREPGGVATPASFAWINASWGNPEGYFRLRRESMAQWRQLAAELPELRPVWSGGLCWDLPPAEQNSYVREQGSWGCGIRSVDRHEAARLEPQLANPPEAAVHVPEEGAIEPKTAALTLLAGAERLGTRLIAGADVRRLSMQGDCVVGAEVNGQSIKADEVVLAAGAGTPALAAHAGLTLPVTAEPGLLVHSKPHELLLNGLVLAPELHMRQTAEGCIVAGADFGGGDPGKNPATTARDVFRQLQSMLTGGEALELAGYSVGFRPMPSDGFPIIGRLAGRDGLYVAVLHSGITLAPAVGSFAAEELLRGRRDSLLAPYGPARFTADARA